MKITFGVFIIVSFAAVAGLAKVVDTVVQRESCADDPNGIIGPKGIYKFAPFSLGKEKNTSLSEWFLPLAKCGT